MTSTEPSIGFSSVMHRKAPSEEHAKFPQYPCVHVVQYYPAFVTWRGASVFCGWSWRRCTRKGSTHSAARHQFTIFHRSLCYSIDHPPPRDLSTNNRSIASSRSSKPCTISITRTQLWNWVRGLSTRKKFPFSHATAQTPGFNVERFSFRLIILVLFESFHPLFVHSSVHSVIFVELSSIQSVHLLILPLVTYFSFNENTNIVCYNYTTFSGDCALSLHVWRSYISDSYAQTDPSKNTYRT